ncbi:hypothetical protein PV328_011044 [Microctonus aethiopoides]|uniref:Uncharacterized protein n=1 Tax=Microctonus aethiopoides TaxID=144406 RepID=A0AA39C3K6_9HYME|nr:hypothetical protein PV328_011044 [Microctonus aethiopoides]
MVSNVRLGANHTVSDIPLNIFPSNIENITNNDIRIDEREFLENITNDGESVDEDLLSENMRHDDEFHDNDRDDEFDNKDNDGVFSGDDGDDDFNEIAELRKWVIENKIPHNHVDSLLLILRKRLLKSLPKTWRISVNEKYELARRTKMIQEDIPDEFPRKMRSTADHEIFKAVEYEFFVNYCGPIVLKKLTHENLYNHFIFLHVGCRILCHHDAPKYSSYARSYFETYVKSARVLL